jgi:hypothetical protein
MLNRTAAVRTAIEFLTVWMEPDHAAAAVYITDVIHDPDQPEAAGAAVTGLLNLSKILLFKLAREQGATSDAEIQGKAGEILRELSLRLPE